MVNTKKDEKQSEGSAVWLESDRINTLVFGTGTGKSKIAIDIIEELFLEKALHKDSKILLLTNSEELRDKNWKAEFDLWGASGVYSKITSECYQTAYKWKNTQWDLVIADEIDFALTNAFSDFFTNNSYTMLLGLTGFVDPSKEALLNTIAPIVMEYTTQDAQNDGILNKTQVVFVEYELGEEKTMEVKYKDPLGFDKSFKQSEAEAYEYLEKTCNITWGKINNLETKAVMRPLTPEETKELGLTRFKNRKATADRKKLLLTSQASVVESKRLVDKILESEDNKVIVFSMLTDHSSQIVEHTYNGKNKKDNTSLEDISSGKIRKLGVCKAIDRGVNLKGINNEVMSTYEGSKTAFIQRHGRGCRLRPDQTMYLYIMLPYYNIKVDSKDIPGQKVTIRKPTQMIKWAESMLQGFDYSNAIKIRYDKRRNDYVSC